VLCVSAAADVSVWVAEVSPELTSKGTTITSASSIYTLY